MCLLRVPQTKCDYLERVPVLVVLLLRMRIEHVPQHVNVVREETDEED